MSEIQIEKIIVRVVVQRENDVLLLRRSETDGSRAGVWELPGGGVDEGESLEEAAAREVYEEAGLVVEDLRFMRSAQYVHPDGSQRMGAVFVANSNSDEVKLSFEHDDHKWVSLSNIHNTEMEEVHKKDILKLVPTDEKPKHNDEIITTHHDSIIAYTDGGSRGNPGPSATGYVIMDTQKRILIEGGEYLGITTNNQAEYQAVRTALQECTKLQAKKVEFFIDSLLVVNQMNGVFKVKNRDLWPIHEDIKNLVRKFDRVTFTHVRREKNKLADAKVNEVLDNYEK